MYGTRAEWANLLRWTPIQLANLERAEILRRYGQPDLASIVVAVRVSLPLLLRPSDFASAVNLDLSRWYAAYTGEQWDGNFARMVAARDRARRQALDVQHGRRAMPAARPDSYGWARRAHLLVDPLDARPSRREVDIVTECMGWPDAHWAGKLLWDAPDASTMCCYCGAVLLRDEARLLTPGSAHVYGANCCSQGYACRTRPSRYFALTPPIESRL